MTQPTKEITVDPTNDQLNEQLEGAKPEGEGSKPAERQPNPRELAIEAIKVRREGEEETPADDPAKISQQLEQQTNEPVVLADGLDRTMVRVKVDGEERLVPVADVVARYQKNEAADKRLAEAAALLQQAQAAQKPPAQVDAAPAQTQTPAKPQPGGVEVGQTVKAFLEALYEGDQDKAAAALQEVVESGRHGATPIDPQTLASQVAPAIRQQLADESALDKFLDTNAHIANDPHLLNMTVQHLNDGLRSGKAYSEALFEAGQRTTDWLKGIGAKVPEPGSTISREQKLAQKGAIDEIRPASITAANTVAAPESASEVINQMRKARGLPV